MSLACYDMSYFTAFDLQCLDRNEKVEALIALPHLKKKWILIYTTKTYQPMIPCLTPAFSIKEVTRIRSITIYIAVKIITEQRT